MTPQFLPRAVNDPFGDPAVHVDCLFERRALMFDLGDIRALATRKMLRVSDVFVTHAHMDHFIGFDWLIRVCLGRGRRLRLYGPPGFIGQVEHKLLAYTWNLVHNYEADFVVECHEIGPDEKGTLAKFGCRSGFQRQNEQSRHYEGGLLLDEEAFLARYTMLDHGTPSLAFALEEKQHVNIWKNRLDEMGLGVGPWLKEFKHAVLSGQADDAPVRAWWRDSGDIMERWFLLGELKSRIINIVPGQKIAYVADCLYSPENARRIIGLAKNADLLYIEAPFTQDMKERAAEKHHLTAYQAGLLARQAGAKRVSPFHFSPIFRGEEEKLRRELADAYGGPVL